MLSLPGCSWQRQHYLFAALARARSVSTSRSRGSALVTSESSRFWATLPTSSMARLNAASFAFEGLLKPESFLTNWSDASPISSSVAGGSKLNKVLMFRHIIFSFPLLYHADLTSWYQLSNDHNCCREMGNLA